MTGKARRSTRGRGWVWTIGFGVLVSIGCSSVPENHYFTMAYTLLPQHRKATTPLPVSLRVRQLEIVTAYDKDTIVYRYSPYEFKYYNYMLWAAKPQKLLTDLLVSHLENTGLFQDVSMEFEEREPNFEMWGAVHAIEELDSGDEWFAHLSFSLRMSRFREEKVVWAYQVDVKKQVYNKAPVYVVKALSELMEEELEKISVDLEKFFTSQAKEEHRP